MKHLPKELKKNDWDLLVAHFLGVDHCGHKYGPTHYEMTRKLTEMNDVIKKLVETIDDDTMLLVMGDHGMTSTGDHGGGSEDETDALLFAFSKQHKFVPKAYDNNVNVIQQIDLTPTLSTILGIPVPFSNLGKISLQLLPDISINGLHRHQLLLTHLWHNSKQIKNYFTKYSEENEKTFSYDDLDEFETKFEIFEHRANSIHTDDAFINFATDLKNYLENMLVMCRNVWIKFNPQLMTQGMVLTFLGTFVSFIVVCNLPLKEFPKVFNNIVIGFSLVSSVAGGAAGYFLHLNFGWDDGVLSALFMSSSCNILIFGYIIVQNWTCIADGMNSLVKLANIVPRITFMFTVLVFFSNSFIIYEQKILSYLLCAQVIYAVYELKNSTRILDFKGRPKLNVIAKSTFTKVVIAAIATIVALRMSHSYFKCREEQGDCWDFLTSSEKGLKKGTKMDLIPVVVLAVFVTIIRIFLRTSGNLTGFSLHVLMTKFGPMLSVITACGHLVLSQNLLKKTLIPAAHLDTLAWIVYGVLIIEVIVIFISPLLIHVVPRNNDKVQVSNYSNMIPELFKHVKNVFNTGSKSGVGQIPIIYGLATVYSSVFIAFAATFGIVLALLLGVKVSNGLVLTIAIAVGILFIYSVLRYESTDNAVECLQPQFSMVVSWFLLVNYGFYATSHQPTISQIDWSAAFVGRSANIHHSNILSAILVLISTFNSNIIFLTIYPLLVLFPFMIYAIYPQLSVKVFSMDKKKREEKTSEYRRITLSDDISTSNDRIDFDVTRGEINLFENETLFITSVFKVGCQLMILQGIKALASMIACTILCRHLMVWKIFAPRFIYEGIGSYTSFVAIVFGFMLIGRINVSVKSLVLKINKKA